ncbi:MAG: nicotinamide-nucleotide amidohydrolase family protein [Methylococcaceae bacterium]|nr:nicotinamide-nucleotide amidohydrolase family protein [Methylococcaceae bacterium]
MDNEIIALAAKSGSELQRKGLVLALAESCTGGGIAQAITEIDGSSQWFDRGFVTYSNQAKIDMLGVNLQTLDQFGAVSAETALEMVQGTLEQSQADCAISVTGIAGSGGGRIEKPVGTVFIGWYKKNTSPVVEKYLFKGDRGQVRQQAIIQALKGLLELI